MNLDNILHRGFLLDKLLKERKTGSIEQLAAKLQLSKRQTYKYLKAFRNIGKDHRYNRELKSYIYVADNG